MDEAFIAAKDFFFLATADTTGKPSCSFKAGPAGFVKIVDRCTLAFPCYDGNGMYLSMGNLLANPKVGMLFLDFEKPNRLRVSGEASITEGNTLLADYPEAQFVIRVAVTEIFLNCPRYTPKLKRVANSPFVPVAGRQTPFPNWKQIDFVRETLPSGTVKRRCRCRPSTLWTTSNRSRNPEPSTRANTSRSFKESRSWR